MQMIDLMKRLAELDAKNPNVVKEHGRTENLSELSRELAVRAFRAGEKKLDNKYTQAQRAIQSRQSNLDHPMDDPAVQRAQKQTNRFDAYIDKAAARERGMKESDDDLVGMVQSTIEDILSGAQQGQDMTDNIADELGDYFDAVQNSGDENLQQAYSMVRDAADTSPEEQAQAAQSALEMLAGGQSVAEGSSGNYTFTTALNGMLGDDKEFEVTYYYDKGADAVTHGSLPSDSRPASVEVISVKDLETGQDVSKNTVGKNIWAEFEEAAEYDYIENHRQKLGECGMMGSMSQPHSPASINMTAATGDELSAMLKDIMTLAGRPMQEPMGDMEPMRGADGVAVVDVEPSPDVGADEPSIMRSMIDRLNPDVDNKIGDDGDEKTDETYDNSPDVHVAGYDAAVPSGNDLHKEKQQFPATQRGDNPMAVNFESLMAEYKKFISEN